MGTSNRIDTQFPTSKHMGPITLFDKSFLQSLSIDEAVWFDNFFLTNIPPIFFIETLSDLAKTVRKGRMPEQEVRIIASKTPERNTRPNAFHIDLYLANLMGYPVPMDRRIIVPKGEPVATAKQRGIRFDLPPETEAFARWQNEEFMEVEKRFARNWRAMIKTLDLHEAVRYLNAIGILPCRSVSLEKAKEYAEFFVNEKDYSIVRKLLLLKLLGVPQRLYMPIIHRWASLGYIPFSHFAPYAAYVLILEIFFYVAGFSDLISLSKISNKLDLVYLFYLPFCMIFVSSDNFHRKTAPLFLGDDQKFVWGPDLKLDLQKIDAYYDRLPESEKEKGLYEFASRPPYDQGFLVCCLWDQFLPGWRARSQTSKKQHSNDDLLKKVKEFTEAKSENLQQTNSGLPQEDFLVMEKKVHRRRGKWWQVPKDLES